MSINYFCIDLMRITILVKSQYEKIYINVVGSFFLAIFQCFQLTSYLSETWNDSIRR